MKKLFVLFTLVLTLLAFAPVQAASPNDLPVDQWTNQQFFFLTLPSDRQVYGYEVYPENTPEIDIKNSVAPRLPFAAHEGKILTVTNVFSTTTAEDGKYYIVSFTEEGTNMKLKARTFREQIEGLALVADREKAMKEFVGKTIYAKRRSLISHPNPGTILVNFGEPMKVVDVWYGFQASEPLLIVVEVNGQKAVISTAYSWTNLPVNTWQASPPWQKNFFLEDPRTLPGMTPKIWDLVSDSQVDLGMTTAQVRLSWGSPSVAENGTTPAGIPTTVWTYGTQELTFLNDVLTEIKTSPMAEAMVP